MSLYGGLSDTLGRVSSSLGRVNSGMIASTLTLVGSTLALHMWSGQFWCGSLSYDQVLGRVLAMSTLVGRPSVWWPQLSPWSGQLWRCTLGRMSSVLVASTTSTLGGRMNCSYSLSYDQNR
jgi:hypothetical protein